MFEYNMFEETEYLTHEKIAEFSNNRTEIKNLIPAGVLGSFICCTIPKAIIALVVTFLYWEQCNALGIWTICYITYIIAEPCLTIAFMFCVNTWNAICNILNVIATLIFIVVGCIAFAKGMEPKCIDHGKPLWIFDIFLLVFASLSSLCLLPFSLLQLFLK